MAIALGLFVSSHLSYAATFTVNRGLDSSFDGCTLRAALDIINSGIPNPSRCRSRGEALGTNDTITFGVSAVSDISTPLSVQKCVKINPNGTRVSILGTGDSRLMSILNIRCNRNSPPNVQINNIVFSGGNAREAPEDDGGALHITFSRVEINNSEFNNNNARVFGGAIYAVNAFVSLEDSVVRRNVSDTGGGIYAASGELTLNKSEISDNETHTGNGGGVFASGALKINHSTVSDNVGSSNGGGIIFKGSRAFSCNYSTISGNRTVRFFREGGGIYFDVEDQASATINACIIAGNDSVTGDEISVSSSNFSFEGAANLFGESSNPSSTAFSGFTPRDIDIIATSDGNTPTPLASILLPLADNGGATRTHALPEGSPALDKITGRDCTELSPSTDQRGLSRPSGMACDIGAFEYQQATSSFFVIPVGNRKSVIIDL